jgi:hypothetical protein
MSQGERIRGVEVEVRELKRSFEEHKTFTTNEFKDLNTKLDELLTLRNKGIGAFWLISSLVGTGIIGLMFQFTSWFKAA